LTGQGSDNLTGLVMHEVKEIETWVLRLLSAPVPVPGKTRVEVSYNGPTNSQQVFSFPCLTYEVTEWDTPLDEAYKVIKWDTPLDEAYEVIKWDTPLDEAYEVTK
jgi:hypothetical protein